MNTKLLKKIRKIVAVEKRWCQGKWIYVPDELETDKLSTSVKDLVHNCDTACCVAGWAVALHPDYRCRNYGAVDFFGAGRMSLGLSYLVAEILFDADNTKEQVLAYLDALIAGASDYEIIKLQDKLKYPDDYDPTPLIRDHEEVPGNLDCWDKLARNLLNHTNPH